MDINNRQTNPRELTRQRYEQSRLEAVQETSSRVKQARLALARLSQARAESLKEVNERLASSRNQPSKANTPDFHREDRVEISATARALAGSGKMDVRGLEDQGRSERVEKLRQQYNEGSLNSPEAVERAAERMLSPETL